MTDAILAVRHGEVSGICVVDDDPALKEVIIDWFLDPQVEELVRTPLDIAREMLFSPVSKLREVLAERSK